MDRRKFLIGMGSTAAGASALVGSGAFTFAQMDRGIQVDVVNDDKAYLALKEGGENGEYASVNSGEIEFEFTDGQVNGNGINQNSVYLFDDVARVINKGSQTIGLTIPDTSTNGWWSTNFVAYVGTDDNRRSIWGKDGNTSNFDQQLNGGGIGSLDDLMDTGTDVKIDVGNMETLGFAFVASDGTPSKSTDIILRAEG